MLSNSTYAPWLQDRLVVLAHEKAVGVADGDARGIDTFLAQDAQMLQADSGWRLNG